MTWKCRHNISSPPLTLLLVMEFIKVAESKLEHYVFDCEFECMCISVGAYIYVCVRMCVCVNVCVLCLCGCVCVCEHVCVNVCVCVCVCPCLCVDGCVSTACVWMSEDNLRSVSLDVLHCVHQAE